MDVLVDDLVNHIFNITMILRYKERYFGWRITRCEAEFYYLSDEGLEYHEHYIEDEYYKLIKNKFEHPMKKGEKLPSEYLYDNWIDCPKVWWAINDKEFNEKYALEEFGFLVFIGSEDQQIQDYFDGSEFAQLATKCYECNKLYFIRVGFESHRCCTHCLLKSLTKLSIPLIADTFSLPTIGVCMSIDGI